ncbi:MAG: tRNA 5-methoxyuridine(34)/uridine 5-oxyacetic acid(34) synthase CmoB [Gammaproteobacteria bacterium]|nr:tRNA 5-methoxyuridine(34)/uridine 5-oxyacetic acid(34) synthase CmoB [Gammaproteobacteria bacterium]
MIDFSSLYHRMANTRLAHWSSQLPDQLDALFHQRLHGDLPGYLETVRHLPALPPGKVNLQHGEVSVHAENPLPANVSRHMEALLLKLHPWRKGPYDFHGVRIDCEWRSDWKWDRLVPHITPLENRIVLDVGCGNGYHCWRMVGAGAGLVIGIDPTQLYLAQFLAARHFLGNHWPVGLLPFGIEDLPRNLRAFDTLFSMGILYHRRSPMDHLLELKSCLRQGGELVLETLVIEGGNGKVLVPEGRYAKMRNVWFIPSPDALKGWLTRCGFHRVRVVDVSPTTTSEQRSTDWMRFESLADFLDPDDPTRTIEGYPAPRRAIFVAKSG